VKISDLVKKLDTSPRKVRRAFLKWCEFRGYNPKVFKPPGKKKAYDVPEEAVPWIKNYIQNARNRRGRLRREIRLKLGLITLKDIAISYNVNVDFVRKEFHWWCKKVGVNPRQYYLGIAGYVPPREFINYIVPVVKKHSASKKVLKYLDGLSSL